VLKRELLSGLSQADLLAVAKDGCPLGDSTDSSSDCTHSTSSVTTSTAAATKTSTAGASTWSFGRCVLEHFIRIDDDEKKAGIKKKQFHESAAIAAAISTTTTTTTTKTVATRCADDAGRIIRSISGRESCCNSTTSEIRISAAGTMATSSSNVTEVSSSGTQLTRATPGASNGMTAASTITTKSAVRTIVSGKKTEDTKAEAIDISPIALNSAAKNVGVKSNDVDDSVVADSTRAKQLNSRKAGAVISFLLGWYKRFVTIHQPKFLPTFWPDTSKILHVP